VITGITGKCDMLKEKPIKPMSVMYFTGKIDFLCV